MPPLLIAGAAAVAGQAVAGGVAAGQKADAAQNQQNMAINAAKEAKIAALPSAQEIAMIDSQIQQKDITIGRERKLIEAVDPTLIEAGKQAFQLLQGKDAEILGPIQRQRARQKQNLQEQLRRNLGPGYETSSAGIEALGKFDAETSNISATAQQNAVGMLLGSTQQTAGMARAGENAGNQMGFQALAAQQNIQSRQLSAANGMVGAITGTSSGIVNSAGGVAGSISDAFGGFSKLAGFAMGAPKGSPSSTPDPAASNAGAGGIPWMK